MDKTERKERQQWLRDMASMFDRVAKEFGDKALDQMHIDGWINAWIQDAEFFRKQFLNRAELYDAPFIDGCESDDELKRNAQITEMILKKLRKIHEDEKALQIIEDHCCEIEHILKVVSEREV